MTTTATRWIARSERRPATHVMGIRQPEGTDLQAAMENTRLLGWDVTTQPLNTTAPDGTTIPVVGRVATVRRDRQADGGWSAVGAGMTPTYKPVQNETVAEFVSDLLDVAQGDLTVDAGGSYANGAKCFLSLRVPGHITVGGVDPIETYLYAGWGHDGQSSLSFTTHDIRMFCTNQIAGILRSAPRYTARHVGGGLDGRIAEARKVLALAFQETDEVSRIAEQWAAQAVTDATFDKIVQGLLPDVKEDATPGARTRRENQQGQFRHLFTDADTNANIRGTAWGALNAWTEMLDWGGSYASDSTRALAQMDSSGQIASRRRAGARVIADLAKVPLGA